MDFKDPFSLSTERKESHFSLEIALGSFCSKLCVKKFSEFKMLYFEICSIFLFLSPTSSPLQGMHNGNKCWNMRKLELGFQNDETEVNPSKQKL